MEDHNLIHIHIHMLLILSTCWVLLSHSEPPAFDYLVCVEQSYECGNLSNISYPFWGQNRPYQCGGGDAFELNCHDDKTTTIRIGSQNFTVKEINITAHAVRLVRTDLAGDVCSPQFDDTNYASPSVFQYSSSVYNVSIFYDCPPIEDFPYGHFTCGHGVSYFEEEYGGLYHFAKLQNCKQHLHVPTDAPPDDYAGGTVDDLTQGLHKGFEVNYNVSEDCTRCLGSGVDCWSDGIEKHVVSCYYCPHGSQSHAPHCSSKSIKWNKKRKLVIVGVTCATIVGVLISIAILCLRYKSSTWQGHFGLTTKSNQNIEDFLKNHGALTLKRYKLSEVKKMTNNFKVKLGQGGFGVVYKGNIFNGSPVAVKILNASKKNGEEFMNEVASISRTSHVNVVTLLGFSLEGHKRALIYEFMPNGSLDKFIYRKGPETITPLSWDIIYQISMSIARGLEYLHKGCNTRILHFDIKPHNILLDEKFCPKIADFGLAKLCPRNESIISMSNARGTMGYVAPEMWSRHLGGVSHKSDVYSYGMMLLEMVGGRKNINAETSHTSEIYFPHWAYNKLELDNDLRPDKVMSIEENEIAKRLAIVGLWCIQTFPNDRPTMSKVIDMLEGSMNSLKIPPKPLLSSPTASATESSIP